MRKLRYKSPSSICNTLNKHKNKKVCKGIKGVDRIISIIQSEILHNINLEKDRSAYEGRNYVSTYRGMFAA